MTLTVSDVYKYLLEKKYFSKERTEQELFMLHEIEAVQKLSRVCSQLPPEVLLSANHTHGNELEKFMTYALGPERVEIGIWLNKKLEGMQEPLPAYLPEFRAAFQKIVQRRSELTYTSLDEAVFRVTRDEFLKDPESYVKGLYPTFEEISAPIRERLYPTYRDLCATSLLSGKFRHTHPCVEFHTTMVRNFSSKGYQGWEEYEGEAKREIKRILNPSAKGWNLLEKSMNGILEIAELYKYLAERRFQDESRLSRLKIIGECVANQRKDIYSWFAYMSVRELSEYIRDSKHPWILEVNFFAGWNTEKMNMMLQRYVPIYDLEDDVKKFFPRTDYIEKHGDLSLNDMILELHFELLEESVSKLYPTTKRWAQVYKLGIVMSYLKHFGKRLSDSERFLSKAESHYHPEMFEAISAIERRRIAVMREYVERTEKELSDCKNAVGPLSPLEEKHAGLIEDGKFERLNIQTVRDIYAESKDCVFVVVNGRKHVLPKAELDLFRSLLEPFDTLNVHGSSVVCFDDSFYRVTRTKELDQLGFLKLFDFVEGVSECVVCQNERETFVCGNGCSTRFCRECFTECYRMKDSICYNCRVPPVPLGLARR